MLLNEGLPVGVVTSIAGGTRVRARVEGLAGHAGTVPMPARRDALAAASEMVLAIERHCAERAESLVGTVGKLAVAGGGAINVIPGAVEFTVDLRSGDDAKRKAAVAERRARMPARSRRAGASSSSLGAVLRAVGGALRSAAAGAMGAQHRGAAA